jgi:ribonuclease-3
MAKMDKLQRSLGYSFKDGRLLKRALTHSSHSHERRSRKPEDYERLEFLGDALLGFLVGDWLFKDDDRAAEGVLSRRRQSVVRASTLAAAARRLGLGESILLGKGEERTGGRRKASLLADLFEAVLGAVYLDGGIRPARAFVRRHLGAVLRETRSTGVTADDFKTRLQERTQAELQLTPCYRIVAATGPPHARKFMAEVVLGDDILGGGEGPSRKLAEQEAAKAALQRLEETGG